MGGPSSSCSSSHPVPTPWILGPFTPRVGRLPRAIPTSCGAELRSAEPAGSLPAWGAHSAAGADAQPGRLGLLPAQRRRARAAGPPAWGRGQGGRRAPGRERPAADRARREERREEGAEPGEPPPREEGEEAGCFLAHSRPARVTHSFRKLPGLAQDPRAAAADPGEERWEERLGRAGHWRRRRGPAGSQDLVLGGAASKDCALGPRDPSPWPLHARQRAPQSQDAVTWRSPVGKGSLAFCSLCGKVRSTLALRSHELTRTSFALCLTAGRPRAGETIL